MTDLSRYQYPPQPHYTVHEMSVDYVREKWVTKGRDPRSPWANLYMVLETMDPKDDAAKLTQAHVENFVDEMSGLKSGTLRRVLTIWRAALRHAERRDRIPKAVRFDLPDAESAYRRPLTEAEFRLAMSKTMSARLRRFYYVAYYTGHRARAIEELTWDRVDFKKRQINFNVPGRAKNNKRRCESFPIVDEFLARLEGWHKTRKDDYVIGLSRRGVCSSTLPQAIELIREKCGLTDPTLVPRHCMRKMFATEYFNRGGDPEVCGILLADKPDTLRKNYVTFKHAKLLAGANLRAGSND